MNAYQPQTSSKSRTLQKNDHDAFLILLGRSSDRLEPVCTIADVCTQLESPLIDGYIGLSLVLYHQPSGSIELYTATVILNDMTKMLEPIFFQNWIHCGLDFLSNKITKSSIQYSNSTISSTEPSQSRYNYTGDSVFLLKSHWQRWMNHHHGKHNLHKSFTKNSRTNQNHNSNTV